MPEETIRERTFCCGSGAGLHAGEDMELRMRGGFARANAVRHVRDKHGGKYVSVHLRHRSGCLPDTHGYWAPEVGVTGIHELLANAMIMDGERRGPRISGGRICPT